MSESSLHSPLLSESPQRAAWIGGDPVGLDRVCWIFSVALAGLIFGLLANQHWVPGGDSELYVATARNLVLHHFSMRGYLFNGQPLTISPPGWPLRAGAGDEDHDAVLVFETDPAVVDAELANDRLSDLPPIRSAAHQRISDRADRFDVECLSADVLAAQRCVVLPVHRGDLSARTADR